MKHAAIVALAALLVMGANARASAADEAAIVNSGSTNTVGYTIAVNAGGTATLALQPRGEPAQAPKAFEVAPAVVTRFFADVKAARGSNGTSGPCMKSASFGSSTHVTWQGWTSPDLECPSQDAAINALATDVRTLRTAAGVGDAGPLRVRPSAPPVR